MKTLFTFLITIIGFISLSQITFGNGSDGSTSISTNSIVNSYHKILNISGATFTLINNTAFSLSNGNVVLVINMLSGEYELRQVSSVSGVYINLDLGSIPNSNFATNSQIIKVPQYSSLTVNAGGSITCPSWDGETGGVICFLVSNTLNLNNGQINASGKGFYNGLGGDGGVGGNGGLGGFSGTNLSSNGGQSGYGGSGYGGAGWGGDLGFSPSLATAGTSSYFNSLANNLPCGNLVPSCNNSPNPSGRLYMGDGSFGGNGGQGKYGAGGGGSKCNQPGIDGGNGGNGGIGGDGGKGGGIIFIKAGNIVHGNTSINVSGTGGTNGLAGTNGGNGGDGTCGGGGGNGGDGGDGGGGGHGGAGGAVKIVKSGGLVLPNLVNVQGGSASNGGSGGAGGFGGANSTNTSGLCACGTGYSCSFPMLIPYLDDVNTTVSVDVFGNTHFIYINGDSILDLVYSNETFCNGYFIGLLQGQLIEAGTIIATYLAPIASLSDNILASLIDFVVNNTPNLDFFGYSILTTNYHLIDGCVCSNCGPSILAEDGDPGNNGPEGSSGGDGYYDEECASVVTPVFISQTLCQNTSPMPLLNVSNNGVSGTWFPPVISTFTSGTFIYTFTPNAGQCATTATITVTVIHTPSVNAVNNQTVCNNTSSLPVFFIGTGTSYTWTNNNTATGLSSGSTGNIESFTTTNATNAAKISTVTVTPSYWFCTGTPQTFTITVNPTPVVNTIPNVTICNGSPTNSINFSGSGTSYTWVNNNTTTGLQLTGTGNITSFNAVNLGLYPIVSMVTVTPQFTGGGLTCPGNNTSFDITVYPTPVINNPTNLEICSGNSVNAILNANIPSNYQWFVTVDNPNVTGESIFLASSNIINDLLVNHTLFVQQVTYNVFGTSTLNGCSSPIFPITVFVNPSPTAMAGGSQTICSNTSATVNGASAANGTILWTHNGLGTITNGQGTLSPTYTANASDVGNIVTLTMTVTSSFTPACVPAATATYTIIVNSSTTTTTATATACDSYVWNGTSYSISGLYTGTTANCITESLNLTITPSSTNTTTASACDSYVWNGTSYSTSGVYTGTTANCITESLNLTIMPSDTNEDIITTACNSYTWIGQTYTQSGTYTGTTANCVTQSLYLTIIPSSTNTTTVTACDSYLWNGQTYTQSGTFTGITSNCVTQSLNLTINTNTSSSISQTALDSYTWLVNNQTYTTTGAYTAVIPNASGCDSTITLNLTMSFTGINDLSASKLSIYPNPTNGDFTITGLELLGSVSSLSLTDMNGKVVKVLDTKATKFSMASIKPGVYFLNIRADNKQEVLKIVKE